MNPKQARRERALERLEVQLATGRKPEKRTHPFHNRKVPLTAEDASRIRQEIRTLGGLA